MDTWQRALITDNLPDLIKTIPSNVIFVSQLQKDGLLSEADVDVLNGINGNFKKAKYLLSILTEREGAFKNLAKALLQESKHSGAFSILLKGIQKHGVFKDVLFDGLPIPLQNVCKSIDQKSLQNIIASEVNAETYEEFLNPEPWTLAIETIPKRIPYYIPRTLSINTEINPEIFQKLENDIFCIEGHELNELSWLAKGRRNSLPDRSRNQIYKLTTTLILLECNEHFQDISEKVKLPVHWIKYCDGKYWYVKSNPASEVKNVGRFLVSKCEKNLTEDEFVERCINDSAHEPVFIYDSPGMGKSVLLAEFARNIKKRRPESSVIYCEISDLVRKVRQVDKHCASAAVKQILVECIAANELGRKIMVNLLNSRGHQIHLFLDGYDEVLQNDSSDTHKMLDNLVKESKNIRIFVATRPHRRKELEEKFGVLGYNMLPFDASNKLSFFLGYWQSEHGVEITDKIEAYAKHCLKTVLSEMSSEEGDLAGIPLQCRMLAEIYSKNAKRGGLIPTEVQFQLISIFQLYKQFIDLKFSTFCTPAERQMCYDFHVREALRTLFPEKSMHFYQALPAPKDELLYRIGILEPLKSTTVKQSLHIQNPVMGSVVSHNISLADQVRLKLPIFYDRCKSDSAAHGFLHRTLAEYFAAEFLANSATAKVTIQSEFMHLFFQQALMMRNSIPHWKGSHFQCPVVCRFLNFFLSSMHSKGLNFEHVKRELRESKYYKSNTLIELLDSSLRINAAHLYLFLVQIYLDLDEFTLEATSLLRFKENLQATENLAVTEIKTLELINDLKEEADFKKLVTTATKHCSLNLVKLSCRLLESVTGKTFHEFRDYRDDNPIRAAFQRGHYQIFEYLLSFDKEGFYKQPLLHECLADSANAKGVGDKVQIVKLILHDRPEFLNQPHPTYGHVPLLEPNAHFELIMSLLEAGAPLTQISNNTQQNVAHITTYCFSADEYHELIEIIISRNAKMLLLQRDTTGLTPVHRALFRIDLKSETLVLLAKNCNVNFNDNVPGEGTELAIAIKERRSERVIKDIIHLGGDKEQLDIETRDKLAINYNIL